MLRTIFVLDGITTASFQFGPVMAALLSFMVELFQDHVPYYSSIFCLRDTQLSRGRS